VFKGWCDEVMSRVPVVSVVSVLRR
jgi:hypothetical protein